MRIHNVKEEKKIQVVIVGLWCWVALLIVTVVGHGPTVLAVVFFFSPLSYLFSFSLAMEDSSM